ncbi:hypothetical protein CICLE_v10030388mg [Citrus x clementina]|uniref:Uncharacterized protein n=1 Tax=Citrus clementina TaxID=85681 RepID=V4RPQ0_CITCL|nr:hypothetical protein CICLE_v10030388mg [Citrus x clementina]
MASQHGGPIIHDQNLNIRSNGAAAGGKSTVSKASKKGGLGGRKPLADLSNSVNLTLNQSLKKQNSNNFADRVIGASKSKIRIDGSEKKSFSKALEKLQTSGRKALSDISNWEKPHLHEAPKKNLNAKLNIATEEDVSDIAGEGFLHDHQECIKAQTKAVDIDEILRTSSFHFRCFFVMVNFRSFGIVQINACFLLFQPVSPPRYLGLQELPEEQLEDPSPWKYDRFSDLDSPPPCRSLKSPNILWKDHDADFMLTESP